MIMTKEQFNALRSEMESALSTIAEKYNCDVSIGNIKYDDINTDIVVSLRSKGADGKSADQLNFEKYCNQYGFLPEDYGFTFTDGGKTFTFVGFNPKARKNFCLLRCGDKTFVSAPDGIKVRIAMSKGGVRQ